MQRKRRNKYIVIFLVGVMIITFPLLTNYLYDRKVNKLEISYDNFVSKIDSREDNITVLNNLLMEKNKELYDNKQKEFLNYEISYEETLINLTEYGFNDNVIGFLEIPSINVKLPIYLGANEHNMQLGAVHLTGTSYPIGGENTNSVIAAHRGYYMAEMFRHIDKINVGDKLYLKNYNSNFEYIAVKKEIIKPTALDKLTIQEGKDMITIISCHPFPYNYQRYVVYFERSL